MKQENPKRQSWETAEYTDDPEFPGFENLRVVEDFLPSPAELAKAEVVVKVTLALEKDSLDYFKEVAKVEGVPYQRMIRNLIAEYADRQKSKTLSKKALRTGEG